MWNYYRAEDVASQDNKFFNAVQTGDFAFVRKCITENATLVNTRIDRVRKKNIITHITRVMS